MRRMPSPTERVHREFRGITEFSRSMIRGNHGRL